MNEVKNTFGEKVPEKEILIKKKIDWVLITAAIIVILFIFGSLIVSINAHPDKLLSIFLTYIYVVLLLGYFVYLKRSKSNSGSWTIFWIIFWTSVVLLFSQAF